MRRCALRRWLSGPMTKGAIVLLLHQRRAHERGGEVSCRKMNRHPRAKGQPKRVRAESAMKGGLQEGRPACRAAVVAVAEEPISSRLGDRVLAADLAEVELARMAVGMAVSAAAVGRGVSAAACPECVRTVRPRSAAKGPMIRRCAS